MSHEGENLDPNVQTNVLFFTWLALPSLWCCIDSAVSCPPRSQTILYVRWPAYNIEPDFEHSCTCSAYCIVPYQYEYRHEIDTALKTFYLSISRSEGVDLHKNRGSNIYGHTLFWDLTSKESILNLCLPF